MEPEPKSRKISDRQDAEHILENKRILLAPMVRVGTLPFRLLCLRYGADLVWSEEIIDIKLIKTKRIENKILGTIEYVLEDGTVVFQTCEEERGKNVLQIGSSSPERAAMAVKHVADDVAAIDLNMGCPKPFSLKGGMGAALLRQKDNVREILKAMVTNSMVPVTCKIRILPDIEDALEIAKIAEECGVAALTVHGRTPSQEPSHPNDEKAIALIAESVSIPVVANGSSAVIKTRSDAECFRVRTKTHAVMLARCALENPTVFRAEGLHPMDMLAREFVELAARYDLPTNLVKFTVAQMLGNWNPRSHNREQDYAELEAQRLKWLNATMSGDSLADMLPAFGFSSDVVSVYLKKHNEICELWRSQANSDGVITIAVEAGEKSFMVSGGNSPKEMLYAFCKRRELPDPVYDTNEREDRRFTGTVTVGEKKFTSGRIEQRKRVCEQAAAFAALIYLDAFT